MKKTTAALLSLAIMVGFAFSMNTTQALSWSEKRANTNAINDAIQTRQTNYYRDIKRNRLNLGNKNVLEDYHNKNIWENYVTRRATTLNRTGELTSREGVRETTNYVAATTNSKMTMRKGWICYLLRNEAPGEDCYTMGQIDGENHTVATRTNRMREADIAAITHAVRDLNKAAMYSEVNENTKDRKHTFAPNSSQRYYTSPIQKRFNINTDDLDI